MNLERGINPLIKSSWSRRLTSKETPTDVLNLINHIKQLYYIRWAFYYLTLIELSKEITKPDVGNSLIFYPKIKDYLDTKYVRVVSENPQKEKGNKMLEVIVEFLTTKKNSTCEKIAESNYQNNPNSDTRLKTITDNVRKFIKNNLIPLHIVKETGKEKVRNHNIARYSLTLFGILYTIHLSSKKEDRTRIIRNLSQEYSNELPKIFGRLKNFEKIIGKNFEDFLGFDEVGKTIQISEHNISSWILDEFIPQMHKHYEAKVEGNDLVADQISFFIYNNLKKNLIEYQNKIGEKEYETYCEKNKISESKKPKGWNTRTNEWIELPDRHRSTWNFENAEKKWIKLINSNLKIKLWYEDLVEKAISQNQEKNKILREVKNSLN